MPVRLFARAVVCGLLVCLPANSAPAPDVKKPTAEDIAKAEKSVKELLEKLNGGAARVGVVKDTALERALPSFVFLTALFPRYPIARPTPEGLSPSNIYAVGPDGKPQLIKDASALQEFFKKNLPVVKTDDQAKDAARAYVRLAQEFQQDGFFKFTLNDDSTKVTDRDGGKAATARVVVMQGGNGEMTATVLLDQNGKFDKATEEVQIKRGPRPICHATLLLDPNPLVRRIVEQDLLIMGPAAHDYLIEQRAKAPPELQRAIDRIWAKIQEQAH